MKRTLVALLTILSLSLGGHVRAEEDLDFDAFSIEELTSLEVTTAAKRPQRVGDTAAAIYVITAEDIRKSGHTSVPEALRLVPGMQVQRNAGAIWSISARGFEDFFANKLLVLIDGRSVYNNIFSGTDWDSQTPPLDDVERIEVIRGPGATLWGANAVNGVINIITKKAQRTQGSRLAVTAGNQEKITTEARHGFPLGKDATGRLSWALTQSDENLDLRGHRAFDGARHGQITARADWAPTDDDKVQTTLGRYAGDSLTATKIFQPDYSDPLGTPIHDRRRHRGSHGAASWRHELSESNSVELSGNVADDQRTSDFVDTRERSYDLSFQQNAELTDAQRLVWGLGWRRIRTDLGDDSTVLRFEQRSDTTSQYSAFAQHETQLTKSWQFTAGSKISWNDYTGYEIQPSARTLWKPSADQSLWASISRAVRTPARVDVDRTIIAAVIPVPFPPFNLPVGLRSNPHAESEDLIAYELGYRTELTPQLSIDSALFVHHYRKLIEFTPSLMVDNTGSERSNGAELSFNWFPRQGMRLWGSWSTIHFDNTERTPHQGWQIHSSFDLTSQLELDFGVYYNGRKRLPDVSHPTGQNTIRSSSYVRSDARLAWAPKKGLAFALVGQNLFSRHHLETISPVFASYEIERSVFAKVECSF